MERKYDVDCPEADAIEDGIVAIQTRLRALGDTAMTLRNREVDRYRKQQERARQANAARWGHTPQSAALGANEDDAA